jgi:hypothetical protein
MPSRGDKRETPYGDTYQAARLVAVMSMTTPGNRSGLPALSRMHCPLARTPDRAVVADDPVLVRVGPAGGGRPQHLAAPFTEREQRRRVIALAEELASQCGQRTQAALPQDNEPTK